MTDKQKHVGVGAKESGEMRLFHPSAPLCKKYGNAGFNWDQLNNLSIFGECKNFSVIFQWKLPDTNAHIQIFQEQLFKLQWLISW